MTFGAVILAGGKSRRMGRDKAQLIYDGSDFLSRLALSLSGFSERLLSVAEIRPDTPPGFSQVIDEHRSLGPISGLLSALNGCKSDALLFVPCDVPLFTKELADYLCSLLEEGYDAVIAVSKDGQEHPLCAVYRKSTVPFFRAALDRGDRRIFSALDGMRLRKARIWEAGFPDRLLLNINSPEEYALLCQEGGK